MLRVAVDPESVTGWLEDIARPKLFKPIETIPPVACVRQQNVVEFDEEGKLLKEPRMDCDGLIPIFSFIRFDGRHCSVLRPTIPIAVGQILFRSENVVGHHIVVVAFDAFDLVIHGELNHILAARTSVYEIAKEVKIANRSSGWKSFKKGKQGFVTPVNVGYKDHFIPRDKVPMIRYEHRDVLGRNPDLP